MAGLAVLWAVTMTTSVACEADLSVSQCVTVCNHVGHEALGHVPAPPLGL